MQIYQCPNCGRTYTEFENVYYCGNCNYRLLKQEDIKEIKNPKLSKHNHNIVEIIKDPTQFEIECPYCHSTDTKKITNTSKAVHTAIFGFFSVGRNSKQWHCNQCKSDF